MLTMGACTLVWILGQEAEFIAFIKLYNKVNYNFIGLIVKTGYP